MGTKTAAKRERESQMEIISAVLVLKRETEEWMAIIIEQWTVRNEQ